MADETGENMYDNVTLASSAPDVPPPYQPRLQGHQPTSHQPAGGPAAYYPPNANGQSPQQQITVITSGQLPAAATERRDEPCCLMYTPHVALSCFVFWLCGMVIGLVAYILAIVAQSKTSKDATLARRLGHASIAVSVVGIVVGVVILAAVLGTQLSAHTSNSSCPRTQFHIDGKCFQYRTSHYDSNGCNIAFQGTTYYDPQQGYCYYNCSNYLIGGTCYNFRAEGDRCDPTLQGTTYYDQQQGYCYYNCSNYLVGGTCYNFRVESDRCDPALQGATYYNPKQGYCYYNCSNYLVRGTCYNFRVVTGYGSCSYSMYSGVSYCYFNCSSFYAGGLCFTARSSPYAYSSSISCRNAFVSTTYYDGAYCYYNYSSSACNQNEYFAGGSCFRSRSTGYTSSSSCSTWFSGTTFYDGTYCYHDNSSAACSRFNYFVGGACFDQRSPWYSGSGLCSAMSDGDTFLYDGYCYYQKACSSDKYYVQGHCFNFRKSDSYTASNSTCGYAHSGTAFYDGTYCYYNSLTYCAGGYESGGSCFTYRSSGEDSTSRVSCIYAHTGMTTAFDGSYCYYGVLSTSVCPIGMYTGAGDCFRYRQSVPYYYYNSEITYCAQFAWSTWYYNNQDGYCYYNM